MQALRIAASGMSAQQTRVNVTANNIANMSTTGFNARRADFADLIYQQIRAPGTLVAGSGEVLPSGVQIGLGVRTVAVSMEVQQGALRATGGELDLAIEGDGFFVVDLPDGARGYTRDGALKVTGAGVLVTSEGFSLSPEIVVPEDVGEVVISADGIVTARFSDQVQPQEIGRLNLATFVNPKGLEAIGDNLFRETLASGSPLEGDAGRDGRGTIRQRYLEESSVDVVSEITELIEAQRGYELNSRVLSAADEMLSASTRIR